VLGQVAGEVPPVAEECAEECAEETPHQARHRMAVVDVAAGETEGEQFAAVVDDQSLTTRWSLKP
jgi:hypothetical protein